MKKDTTNITECIENLAPVIDGENQEIYIELLEKGINDKKVKNIALSGAYGSGKSSIIQKYLSSIDSSKERILEISLANFDNNIDPKVEEQHIEKSILQQIFYKVSKTELPYSKLERTEKKSDRSILVNTIVFFIWLVSFYIFLHVSEIKKSFIDLFALQDMNIQTIIILTSILPLLFSSFFILYIIVKGTGKVKFNKLSFQGASLEIDKEKGSLINQYIDEILYFFETTDFEVLIIEDLDRQDGTKIFQKLREINTLLNNYTKIHNKKKITFIYAVKDSIFTGEERTKFFELIIPVVPIINTSNAKDILIQKFKKIGILEHLGEDFLKDISYYVHNYRQLTNIVNEFCVYQEALKNTQNYKKLFALIAYKNFFPKDFVDLQSRKGMLHKVFYEKKDELKSSLIKDLESELIDIKERHDASSKEHLLNLRELKVVFASKTFEEVSSMQSFFNNNAPMNINELVDNDELFNQYVVQGGTLNYYIHRHPHAQNNHFKGDQSGEYESRLKVLNDKKLEEKNKLNKRQEELQNKIRTTKYSKLSSLLSMTNNFKIFEINRLSVIDENIEISEIKAEDKINWKLVEKLLLGGYIDEEYNRYISYFHEGELTRNDYDFIIKIKEDIGLDYLHQIDDTQVVINELSINDFKNNIENFMIAEHLLNDNEEDEKRKHFIDNFFEKSSEEFIKGLLEKNISDKDIISVIIKEASKKEKLNKMFHILGEDSIKDLLVIILDNFEHSILTIEDKKSFNTLLHDNLFEIYNRVNNKDIVHTYIMKEYIVFECLDDLKYQQSKELLEFIYKNSLYELTYVNIKTILINLYNFKISNEVNLKIANLTTIKESKAKELINDIDNDIDVYFEDCWLKLNENTKESSESIIYLINHTTLAEKYKIDIIKKSETKITDISLITSKDLWSTIIEENKVEATWKNVFEYYVHIDKLDEYLLDFLNNEENSEQLSIVRVGKKYFEEHKKLDDAKAVTLLKKILENNDFENENYQKLIQSYGYWYSSLDFEVLDKDKIEILINTGRLQPETETFEAINEGCIECAVLFLEHYKDEYLTDALSVSLSPSIMLLLLDSTKFTDEEKISIIEKSDISIFDNQHSLKEKVSRLYIDKQMHILDDSLFEKLFYNEDNKANEWALELYVSQVSNWDCDKSQTYITEFDEPYNQLFTRSASRLYLNDTKLNRSLLDRLKSMNCISSYKPSSRFRKKTLKVERKRPKKDN